MWPEIGQKLSHLTRFSMPDPARLSPLRLIHSLREADVATLSQALIGNSISWTLDRHEGYDGDLIVLLTQAHGGDADLVISRSAAGFQLGATSGDAYRRIGVFSSLAGLLKCLPGSQSHEAASDLIA